MARKSKVEAQLEELEALIQVELSENPDPLISKAFTSKSGVLVSAALRAVTKHNLRNFAGQLPGALELLLAAPWKADPGCEAKSALVELMGEWDVRDDAVLLRGVSYIQPEPVWGGQEDSAGRFRGLCLFELVKNRHPDAPYEAVRLLEDPKPEAREAAAEAVAMLPGLSAELLLRHKIMTGDEDSRVTLMCFEQLARIAPAESLEFFQEYMQGDDSVRFEGAALGIAATHQDEAFGILRAAWERVEEPSLAVDLLNAMALVRSEESFDFLLKEIEKGNEQYASAAVKALSIWQGDEERSERIGGAVAAREDGVVMEVYLRVFGG